MCVLRSDAVTATGFFVAQMNRPSGGESAIIEYVTGKKPRFIVCVVFGNKPAPVSGLSNRHAMSRGFLRSWEV